MSSTSLYFKIEENFGFRTYFRTLLMLEALFWRTFFPKLQTFKTSNKFWIFKSQFLFYSYTLDYFPPWFARKNKLECKTKIKIMI